MSTAADLAKVGFLLTEYRTWLAAHREVTPFDDSILRFGLGILDQEIRDLPGAYAPPSGRLFLATRRGKPVGCAALRRLAPNIAELKRVYVRPGQRGLGLGRRITLTVIRGARRLGYHHLRLDTLPTMTAAIQLYRDIGFREIRPYWPHPVPGALFFEYPLSRPDRVRPRVRARRRRPGLVRA